MTTPFTICGRLDASMARIGGIVCVLVIAMLGFESPAAEAPQSQWAVAITGSAGSSGLAVVADDAGGVYAGFTALGGRAVLGSTVLSGNSLSMGGVVKYDAGGQVVWATLVTGLETAGEVADIKLGPGGKVLVCGTFKPVGPPTGFIAEIAPDGSVTWMRTQADTAWRSLSVGPTGHILVGGQTRIPFAVVASYDQTGEQRWRHTSTRGTNGCVAVSTDAAGNSFFTGASSPTIELGGIEIQVATPSDVFTGMINNTGTVRWVQAANGRLSYPPVSAVLNAGLFLVAAERHIAGYRNDGSLAMLRRHSTSSTITAMTGDKLGFSYVAESVPGNPDNVLNLVAVNFLGGRLWTVTATGNAPARVNAVSVNTQGNFYVCGNLNGDWRFGRHAVSVSSSAAFVAKFGIAPIITTQPLAQTAYQGTNVEFRAAATGKPPIEFQWFKNGARIDDATNDVLTISSVQPGDSGRYSAQVSDAGGFAVSDSAALAVIPIFSSVVTTIAGTGEAGFEDASDALLARLSSPNGVAVDRDGDIYFTDQANQCIRVLNASAGVRTIAGQPLVKGFKDAPGVEALFNDPIGLCVSGTGDLLIAEASGNRIRRVLPIGLHTVTTFAGNGTLGYVDGPAATAQFNFPNDIVESAGGMIYVTEFNNHTVRVISPAGNVSTLAGNGTPGFADGRGADARLNQPGGIAIDSRGFLFITEWNNSRIRRISRAGEVTTIAGTNSAGFRDGPIVEALFRTPDGIAVDAQGNIFVTEHLNNSIRMILPDGMVTTLAGNGERGFADGTNSAARFAGPSAIAVERVGSLIVADGFNHRLRRIVWGPGLTNQIPSDAAVLALDLNQSLTIHGVVGAKYRIESSSSEGSADWVAIEDVVLTSSPYVWLDRRRMQGTTRVYRAVLQP